MDHVLVWEREELPVSTHTIVRCRDTAFRTLRYFYIGVRMTASVSTDHYMTIDTEAVITLSDRETPETPTLHVVKHYGRVHIPTPSNQTTTIYRHHTADGKVVDEAFDRTTPDGYARWNTLMEALPTKAFAITRHWTEKKVDAGPFQRTTDAGDYDLVVPYVPLTAMKTKADPVPIRGSLVHQQLADVRTGKDDLKRLLAETCFHPARLDRMMTAYGEDWADLV
jgi:hypothetical protein